MAEETVTGRGGQPLVRVRRPVGRPRKNQDAEAALGAEASPPEPPPEPREPAGGRPAPKLVTPFDEIPPDKTHATERDTASIGMIELTEDGKGHFAPERPKEPVPDFVAAGEQPRTLDDLFALFPVGDGTGQYYIHVERKVPAGFQGVQTKGIMRRIRDAMTYEKFIEVYGGGTYDLIAYGPPKKGGVLNEATGLPYPKPLTKPVRLVVPWQLNGGYPPNPDAAYELEDVEDESSMANQGPLPFPPIRHATPAAAQMYKTNLDYQEKRENRDREDVRERRRQRREEETTALGVFSQHSARREQELQKTIDRLTAQLEERNSKSDIDGIAKLMQTMGPQRATQSELESLRETHRRELSDIERRHTAELESADRRSREERQTLSNQHRAEIDRLEQRAKNAEDRAGDRVRDVEARLDQAQQRAREEVEKVRQDLGAQHARELEMLRGENNRAIEAMRVNYETRLTSEARSWEREIQTRAQVHESQLATEKAKIEVQLSQAQAELRRRDNEIKEMKDVVAKSKDLSRLLDDARKTAELLGYAPRDEGGGEPTEPPDLKTILMGVLTEGAKRLPELVKNAGDAVAAVRHGQQAQQPQQHLGMQQVPHPAYAPQQQMRAMPPPRTFATESDEQTSFPQAMPFQEAPGVRPPPLQQAAPQPMPVPMAPPVHAQPAPQYQAPPPAPVAAAGAPALTGPMSSPEPPAPGAPPSAIVQAAPAPAVEGDPALDGFVLNVRSDMEGWFEGGVQPKQIAEQVVSQYGKEMVKSILPTLSLAVVTGALKRANIDSPLLSRRGRRFITSIEEAVKAAVQ